MIIFRGAVTTLICNTIELADDRPKGNVVSATVEIVGEDETTVFGPAPCVIREGYVEANWVVPGGLNHDSGRAIFRFEDSFGITGMSVEDVTFTNLTVSPDDFDSILEMLRLIYSVEGGRWRIDKLTGVMSFYEDDNTTVVAAFQLYDRNGAVTGSPSQAYERRRLP